MGKATRKSIVAAPIEDDASVALQLQSFLDSWHYRVMHSGKAYTLDRIQAVVTALDLFSMHGLVLNDLEKDELANMDEDVMITELVNRMLPEQRKSFEHFALQLELVVSSVTRVRHALEDGTPEELASVHDNEDQGISQQVLKQVVIEAGLEVGELVVITNSWHKNMADRFTRLLDCSESAEHAREELQALQAQMQTFQSEQGSKSKNVLMAITGGQDTALLHSCFSAWNGRTLSVKAEQSIHDKFRKQIEDAELRLLEYKRGQKSNVNGVLNKQNMANTRQLYVAVWRIWNEEVAKLKEDRGLEGQMEATRAKLAGMQDSQAAASKKLLTRMCGAKDGQLVSLCFQSWVSWLAEYLKNKDFEDAVKASEQQMQSFMAKKSESAKAVLQRAMAGSDSGLVAIHFKEWASVYLEEKEARRHEDEQNNDSQKFSNLSQKQKKAAKNIANRTNMQDEENLNCQIMLAWYAETKKNNVLHHYLPKLNHKKQQLDAVQNMFKSFATQLEQGISATPRSQRKKDTDRNKAALQQGANTQSAPALPSGGDPAAS